MSILSSWLASPPPDAAIDIAADRVAAAVLALRSDGPVVTAYAVEPLRPGAVTPSLTGANVQDRAAVVAAVRSAAEKLGTRPRRVALTIPDTSVKISLLRFDRVPGRRDDFEQLVKWQLRKAAPFPVEAAAVSHSPGLASGGAREFVVELARAECVGEYEAVCEAAGLYAGLVDTATFGLLGVASAAPPDGDWLLVHVRPDYTSIVIVREGAVIFYRNRPEDGQEGVPDLVHQTSMYYQDRLSGSGFARVYIVGASRGPADGERRAIEDRLGVPVEPLDLSRAATLAERIAIPAELTEAIGPAVGLLRRTLAEVPA
jgi:Tfp pilus assembly PilM family ATPase